MDSKEHDAQKKEETLDSLARVKVLSPGRLVFNRFILNKLAIVGSVILIVMFIFAFILPFLYPYSQTEVFYKYDSTMIDYAVATRRTAYTVTWQSGMDPNMTIENMLNSEIGQMDAAGEAERTLEDPDGNTYRLEKYRDEIYALFQETAVGDLEPFADYNVNLNRISYPDGTPEVEGLADALKAAAKAGETQVVFQDVTYQLTLVKKGMYQVERRAAVAESGAVDVNTPVAMMSTYVLDAFSEPALLTDEFRFQALAATGDQEIFSVGDRSYQIQEDSDEIFIIDLLSSQSDYAAVFSDVAVRSASGEDTMSIAFKEKVREVINEMDEASSLSTSFTWEIPQLNADGKYDYDENGVMVTEPTQIDLERQNESYVMTCPRVTYLIDIYARPSLKHWVGTDADGMDVLARMMYGGRVSLLVCFVVVIIETILGVIMGGIAGFFGGIIDNVIMRLVDIFYCIPSLPILIILGALFDAMKMEPYLRLVWLMAVLGFLGWAGVARLVRGQILSLREQEFMTAAEAIGLSTKKRIFRHLVPNVMPQLIVTATTGLGGIIITESTLSFLGLGVKHPLATWGTMINAVTSSSETMIAYTYIWIPVGLLICLTVIAFNFVGDGLRDAFDPRTKR
jgi:peptide/nickel transport system permease protein